MQVKANDEINIAPAKDVLLGHKGVSSTSSERAAMTLSCRDADYIPRVKNAGSITKIKGVDVQVMHNGIYVKHEGYQGNWQAEVIKGLKGTHEPQEEKVFYEVLKRVEPGSTMLELGSWWSYYSLWFLKAIKNSKAICCEPDPDNIELGRLNMKLNGFSSPKDIIFYPTAAGSVDSRYIEFKTENKKQVKVKIRTVDSILKEQSLKKLEILHLDIQGVELDALKGAKNAIKNGKIRFLFVSTHHYSISGDPLMHEKCLDFIIKNGGNIIAKHTVAESCSGDGLIVASFDVRDKDYKVDISLQPSDESLFRQPEKDLGILWREYDKLFEKIKAREQHLNKEIADTQAKLTEKQHLINWIHQHPLRYILGNTYHVYIKRDRTRKS
jgi:FkbM family methyltransferase